MSAFKRIDKALGKYYYNCGRHDYYDEHGNGKFITFATLNEFDENTIELELGANINPNDCLYVEMDPNFPLNKNIKQQNHNHSRNHVIFNILRHCYKYGIPFDARTIVINFIFAFSEIYKAATPPLIPNELLLIIHEYTKFNPLTPKKHSKSSRPKSSRPKPPAYWNRRNRGIWNENSTPNTFEEDHRILKKIIDKPDLLGNIYYKCKRKSDGLILYAKQINKSTAHRLHPSETVRRTLMQTMQAEIDIMRRLKHRYIVNMYKTYETKHKLQIVMEVCNGGKLSEKIKTKRCYQENDAKRIIKMICQALFYMWDQHRVLHCNLTPDNLLFTSNHTHSDVKVANFGVSKVLSRLKSLRKLCTTPYYTSPEIINGDYSHAADMFSVGAITYFMIFGLPPFYVDPNKYYGVTETRKIYKLILKGFEPKIKEGYGPWFPITANQLSKECRSFIGLLLEKDDAVRLTALEALHHPWLKCNNTNNQTQSYIDVIHITEMQYNHFWASHHFKCAVATIFDDLNKTLQPKDFEHLQSVFKELDTNGNGRISYDKFEQGLLKCDAIKLDESNAQKIFLDMSYASAVGDIDYCDLINAIVRDYLISMDNRLYEEFKQLNGKAVTAEVHIALLIKKLCELNPYDRLNVILEKIDGVDIQNDMLVAKLQRVMIMRRMHEFNAYGNVELISQIVDNVYQDQKVSIDYEKYLRTLHPDFNGVPNWFWSDEKCL